MENENEKKTNISYREFFKALISTLKRNMHTRILDTKITPEEIILHLALQKKQEDIWFPKIIIYRVDTRKVYIFQDLLDKNPVVVDAATFLYMDEQKILK